MGGLMCGWHMWGWHLQGGTYRVLDWQARRGRAWAAAWPLHPALHEAVQAQPSSCQPPAHLPLAAVPSSWQAGAGGRAGDQPPGALVWRTAAGEVGTLARPLHDTCHTASPPLLVPLSTFSGAPPPLYTAHVWLHPLTATASLTPGWRRPPTAAYASWASFRSALECLSAAGTTAAPRTATVGQPLGGRGGGGTGLWVVDADDGCRMLCPRGALPT